MTKPIVTSITDEQLEELEEQYRSEPIPACRVCGSALSVSSMGGGRPTTWNCSNEEALTSNGGMDWDHYEKSRFEQRRVGDSRVLALIARLRAAEKDAARYRWLRQGGKAWRITETRESARTVSVEGDAADSMIDHAILMEQKPWERDA